MRLCTVSVSLLGTIVSFYVQAICDDVPCTSKQPDIERTERTQAGPQKKLSHTRKELRSHIQSKADGNTVNEPSNVGLGNIKLPTRYHWDTGLTPSAGIENKLNYSLDTRSKDFRLNSVIPLNITPAKPSNKATDFKLDVNPPQTSSVNNGDLLSQTTIPNSVPSNAQFLLENKLNPDAGTRYAFTNNLSGLLQANAQWNEIYSGSGTSIIPSPGDIINNLKSVSITPGFSYALSPDTQFYGLILLPVYQRATTEQFTNDHLYSMGFSHHF